MRTYNTRNVRAEQKQEDYGTGKPTMAMIDIATHHALEANMHVARLIGPSRKPSIASVREAAIVEMKKNGYANAAIAAFFCMTSQGVSMALRRAAAKATARTDLPDETKFE